MSQDSYLTITEDSLQRPAAEQKPIIVYKDPLMFKARRPRDCRHGYFPRDCRKCKIVQLLLCCNQINLFVPKDLSKKIFSMMSGVRVPRPAPNAVYELAQCSPTGLYRVSVKMPFQYGMICGCEMQKNSTSYISYCSAPAIVTGIRNWTCRAHCTKPVIHENEHGRPGVHLDGKKYTIIE